MAEHQDVTGITLSMPPAKVSEIILALPSEQQRFAPLLAETVRHPHEIWQAWERDPAEQGSWLNLRTYLQFLDLSATDSGAAYGIAVVRFRYDQNWTLFSMNVCLGEEHSVVAAINAGIRRGKQIYPA